MYSIGDTVALCNLILYQFFRLGIVKYSKVITFPTVAYYSKLCYD